MYSKPAAPAFRGPAFPRPRLQCANSSQLRKYTCIAACTRMHTHVHLQQYYSLSQYYSLP